MSKTQKSPSHKGSRVLSIAFTTLGITLLIAASQQELLAQEMRLQTGKGATLEQTEMGGETLSPGFLHSSAPHVVSSNTVGMVALGMLFVLVGFGFHAMIALREDGRRIPVRRAKKGSKHSAQKSAPRKARKMEVILIDRVFKF